MPPKINDVPFWMVVISVIMLWSFCGYTLFMMNWYVSLPEENIAMLIAIVFIGKNGLRVTSNIETILDYFIPKLERFWENRRLATSKDESK